MVKFMKRLTEIKKFIGNWASPYRKIPNALYCGWMDLHIDEPCGGYEKGIWKLKVIEIDPEAVFVHRMNGVYVIEELEPGKVVEFRYDRWHGLLPRDIAKALEGKRYWRKCKPYTEWFEATLPDTWRANIQTRQDKARILWEFID
jgi:hypothetical protein